MRALVADDDRVTAEILSRTLKRWEFDVTVVGNGAAAWDHLRAATVPTLAILDWMMPGMDGPEVCRRVREELPLANMYLLLVTARESRGDVVAGLDAGADDYVIKPFALRELLARLRALIRRGGESPGETLSFADLRLDPAAYEVSRGGRPIQLTRTEFLLLELFMRNPRQALPRSTIFERVWGYDFGTRSNSLGVYVGYLRRKLEEGGEPRLLHTIRGVGYALREP